MLPLPPVWTLFPGPNPDRGDLIIAQGQDVFSINYQRSTSSKRPPPWVNVPQHFFSGAALNSVFPARAARKRSGMQAPAGKWKGEAQCGMEPGGVSQL